MRAALAASAWLAAAGITLLCAQLPLPARLLCCVFVVTAGIRDIRRVILLRGRFAVKEIDWGSRGEMRVRIGSCVAWESATLSGGCFRLGTALVLLRLTTAQGVHAVLIDGGRQDAAAFRGLCRHLNQALGRPFGRESRPN